MTLTESLLLLIAFTILAMLVFSVLARFVIQIFDHVQGVNRTKQEFENRATERKADLEQRAAVALAAKEAADEAKAVATEVKKIADEVKETTAGVANTLDVVHSAVKEVGEQAKAAYTEANNVNMKIQSLQDVLTKQNSMPDKDITVTTGAKPAG